MMDFLSSTKINEAAVPTDQSLAQASRSLEEINRPFQNGTAGTPTDAQAQLAALMHSLECEGLGAPQLALQVRTLDALFNRLVMKALENHRIHPKATDNIVAPDIMMLALRTQRQCRQTVQALGKLAEKQKPENELKETPKTE